MRHLRAFHRLDCETAAESSLLAMESEFSGRDLVSYLRGHAEGIRRLAEIRAEQAACLHAMADVLDGR